MSNKSCEIQTRKANRSSRQAISNGDTAKRGKTWNNATGSRRPLGLQKSYGNTSCAHAEGEEQRWDSSMLCYIKELPIR